MSRECIWRYEGDTAWQHSPVPKDDKWKEVCLRAEDGSLKHRNKVKWDSLEEMGLSGDGWVVQGFPWTKPMGHLLESILFSPQSGRTSPLKVRVSRTHRKMYKTIQDGKLTLDAMEKANKELKARLEDLEHSIPLDVLEVLQKGQ